MIVEVTFDKPYIIELTVGATGSGPGTPGKDGKDGLSAYEVAVVNGFAGTVSQWLGSLKGEKGSAFTYQDFTTEQLALLQGPPGENAIPGVTYVGEYNNTTTYNHQEAVTSAEGNSFVCRMDGTLGQQPPSEFMANEYWLPFVIKGAPGAAGKDASNIRIVVDNGVIKWGYVDTSSILYDIVTLSSLKGNKGDNGANGIDGKNIEFNWNGTSLGVRIQGQSSYTYVDLKGDKGNDGYSAYEIALQNGFVGTQTQWLESIKGERGESFTFEDLTSAQKEELRGAKGEDGKDSGALYATKLLFTRKAEKPSKPNVTTFTELVEAGDWIEDSNIYSVNTMYFIEVRYNEATGIIDSITEPISLGEGEGSGVPGSDGEDGATFIPHVDEDGNLSWTNNKGLENPAIVNIKGSDGIDGIDGQNGINGINGMDGKSAYQIALEGGLPNTVTEEMFNAMFYDALLSIFPKGTTALPEGARTANDLLSTIGIQNNADIISLFSDITNENFTKIVNASKDNLIKIIKILIDNKQDNKLSENKIWLGASNGIAQEEELVPLRNPLLTNPGQINPLVGALQMNVDNAEIVTFNTQFRSNTINCSINSVTKLADGISGKKLKIKGVYLKLASWNGSSGGTTFPIASLSVNADGSTPFAYLQLTDNSNVNSVIELTVSNDLIDISTGLYINISGGVSVNRAMNYIVIIDSLYL